MSLEEDRTVSPAREIAEIDHTLAMFLEPLKHGYKRDKNAFKLWTADEVYKRIHASIPSLNRKADLYNQIGDSSNAEKEKAKILTLQQISENLHGASPIDQSVLNQIKSIL